jgi:peptidoglycan-N-acetylglucosamine deacetylase
LNCSHSASSRLQNTTIGKVLLFFLTVLIPLFFDLEIPGNHGMDIAMAEGGKPAAPDGEIDALAVATFGSETILEKCWTANELKGSAADKIITKKGLSPDRAPPTRLDPLVKLKPLPDEFRNSIRSVEVAGEQKPIALTFDLCEKSREKAGFDVDIANYLRAHKVKATFFAGGKWMRTHPEKAMQLMADPLFEIGNHAWTHGNNRVLKGQALRDQIMWTQSEYELLRERLASRPCAVAAGTAEMNRIPPVPPAYRFPYGTCSAESLDLLARNGLPAIQWDIVTGDPVPKMTATEIVRTVLAKARPGSIIIGHANGRGHGTAEAVSIFVPELRKRGFEFVTVTELLRSGKPRAVEECYGLRPGDNVKYDAM